MLGLISPAQNTGCLQPIRCELASSTNQTLLTAMVGGWGALRAAVLLAVGGGEVRLGGASAEANLGAPGRHLRHALLGLQGLGPEG